MSSTAARPNQRRVTAVTLAQHASSVFGSETSLRRLFQYPTDTLDQLCLSNGEPTATLLRWSISSLLGGEGGLRSLECARMVWGDDQTAALGIVATSLSFYTPDVELLSYRRSNLALHQLATAWACDFIAMRCNLDRAKAFLVGGLHDIGLLALERLSRRRFVQVIEELDPYTTTSSVENAMYGCDHATVGAEILKILGASTEISEAVRWHHKPTAAGNSSTQLSCVLALANFLTSRIGQSSLGIQNCSVPGNEALAAIGLKYREISEIIGQLTTILPSVKKLL